MSRISQCSGCGKPLRIPAEKAAAVVKCPKCGIKFRPSGKPTGRHPRRDLAPNDHAAQDHADFEEACETLPSHSRKSMRTKGSARSGKLQPFLGRWLIACGIVLTVATLFAVGGMFSETLAIIASVICVVAMLGCLVTGTVWTAIDLGKESILLGISVVLVPVIGPAVAFQKRGPAPRGAVVVTSMIAPTLLLGLLLLVYYPKYTGAGQQTVRTAKWDDLMRRMDDQVVPETQVATVTIRVASRPGSLEGIEPKCEVLLTPFRSYVQGSLKVDAGTRTITYQYRGSERFDKLIAFYLGSSTGAFIPQDRVDPEDAPTALPRLDRRGEPAGSSAPRSAPGPERRDSLPRT